jgi:hypothetical protein
VSACFWVFVPFGQAEVDDVEDMLVLVQTDQEVVRLDISMQEAILVHVLDSLEHLDGQHQHCLEGELAATILKKIFKAGAKHVNYHRVVITLFAEMENSWNSD